MNRSEYRNFLEQTKKQRPERMESIQIPNAYAIKPTHTSFEKVERQEDNVYVNVVFNHFPLPDFSNTPIGAPINEQSTPANYSVTKTAPILDKCSDYYCSVIRFTIPLFDVPLLVCPVIPNTNNLALSNKTPMVIDIFYNGTHFPINLQYIPALLNNPIVLQNQPIQIITPYYYVFNFQTIINMYNNALSVIWITSGLSALFPGVDAPYFILDPVTALISIIVPKCFTQLLAPATSIPILSQNLASAHFMTNFYTNFNGANQPNGDDITFIFSNPILFGLYPPPEYTYPVPFTPATTVYYRFTQEYSSLVYWASIRRLIFTTGGIPVNPEQIPSVVGSGNASQNILTDFIIDTNVIGSSRSIAVYNPSAQYRLIDLNSDTALQKLSITIFWQDVAGNIFPLTIPLFQQASLKMLFVRKDLYKSLASK